MMKIYYVRVTLWHKVLKTMTIDKVFFVQGLNTLDAKNRIGQYIKKVYDIENALSSVILCQEVSFKYDGQILEPMP